MALRVWLPLNGDLHNQGLSDVEVTNSGAIVNNNGKIGKCYQFGTGASYLELPASCMTSFTECSVTFWLKILTWNTNYCTFFQAGKNNSSWADYIFGFLRNNNNSTVCFTIGDGSTSSQSYFLTSNLELNIWYHVALIYKVGKCSIYLNGELDHEYDTSRIIAFNNITRIRLGRSNSTGYQTNCLMNDVRIYDHALSPLEVKKISQGLVLHYRLSGIGGKNLLKNSNVENNHVYDSNDLIYYYFNMTGKLPTGTYTLSFDIKSSNGTDACYVSYANGSSTINRICELTNIPINWTHYSYTFTNSSTTCNDIFFAHYTNHGKPFNANNTGTIYTKNVKLEEGSYPTPWCPATSDDEYSIMGLDDNIEYDCSGFGNNGTANNIVHSSDTPRYTGSYQFNGSNGYVKVNENNWIVKGMSEMTVNLWAKATTWPTTGRLLSCTESGGFNLEAGDSGYWRFPIYVYTNSEHTSSAYKYDSKEIKISDLIPNEWNMITLVYDATGTKTYINGELHHTYTNTSYGINFNTNARLFLGCEASTANPSSPYFNGMESDFRIYSTALSEDDILDLYHLGGSIDSSGTFHTYEYVEGE